MTYNFGSGYWRNRCAYCACWDITDGRSLHKYDGEGRVGLVAAPECRKFVVGRWLVITLLERMGV
jgi:hypothetical protein